MKPLKKPPVKARRQFNETFEREAVQNGITRGKSATVVAEEPGLSAEDSAGTRGDGTMLLTDPFTDRPFPDPG